MKLKENELFPIISPIGYPAAKKRISEQLFRRTLKADNRMPWEDHMQRIDVGIGICHFHLAAMEKNLSGRFEKMDLSGLELPDKMSYITSWVVE